MSITMRRYCQLDRESDLESPYLTWEHPIGSKFSVRIYVNTHNLYQMCYTTICLLTNSWSCTQTLVLSDFDYTHNVRSESVHCWIVDIWTHLCSARMLYIQLWNNLICSGDCCTKSYNFYSISFFFSRINFYSISAVLPICSAVLWHVSIHSFV